MANSSIVSKANHIDIQDHQRYVSLAEIYDDLRNVFVKESFVAFVQKCKQVKLSHHEYPKPIYFPVNFDSAKNKASSTTAKDYLDLLPDGDPNADLKLKSLTPVEIFNDGSVLFRAVASLLGFSSDEDVRELRLRCLLDALSNLSSYRNDYQELLEPLLYPDEGTIKHWSNFVHEKVRMDAPNIVTVLTLIALAKVINIPIRSAYPTPSKQELDENPNHIYKVLNQVFYPPHCQPPGSEIIPKPIIVILWWCTDANGAKYCDHVIPLFPTVEHSVNETMSLISLEKSNTARPLNMSYNFSEERRRGTFILIATTVDDSKASQTLERIDNMKLAIIELMKKVAATALPGDIIEVNTCDEELMQPPLIPFCDAAKVAVEVNLGFINAINFRKVTHFNLSTCISAALDKLARQSIYYTDFFLFVDNSVDYTVNTSVGKSDVRVLRESQSISSQMIVSSEQSTSKKERFKSLGLSRVDYLGSNNNNIRRQITVLYERNHSSQEVQRLKAYTDPILSNTEARSVSVSSQICYVHVTGSTSENSRQDQNHLFRSSTSGLIHLNTPFISGKTASPPKSDSGRISIPSSFEFHIGFP